MTEIPRDDVRDADNPKLSHAVGPRLTDLSRLDRTVGDVLQRAALDFPSQQIIYIDDHGTETSSSYLELFGKAKALAAGLHQAGFRQGDKLILQTARSSTTIPLLWACFLTGVVAVPTPALSVLDEGAAPVRKLHAVWDMLDCPAIAADGDMSEKLPDFGRENGWEGLRVVSFDTLDQSDDIGTEPRLPELTPDTLAMLPLTSGSTGRPKAVELTHKNILAMSAGTNQANGFGVDDVALNWMPLDHPGALVFLGVVPMDAGAAQIHVPTSYVLGDPLRWLDLIDRHRGSISWAPNFAFALINTRLRESKQQYDLSCMRFLVSAGEQVTAGTVQTFLEQMQSNGLPKGALRPAFGMAETCSGITWSPGLTREILADEPTYISLGPVIPGAEMRITDDENNVLPVGEIGALQLRGPSVLAGYYDNPTVNADVMRGDGWFATGDLAYLENDELHITGRTSEVIMINGLNVAANELEALSEELDGVAVSYSAALSVHNENSATEEVILIFSPENLDPGDKDALAPLANEIRSHMARQSGIRPAKLVALPTDDIPKTSIGKIQRAALKKRFLNGELDQNILAEAPRKRRQSNRSADSSQADQDTISDLEEKITALWSDALDIEDIDPEESFFELGGNSLLLIRLQALLRPIAPMIELVDLFQYATIRSQAQFIAGANRDDDDADQSGAANNFHPNVNPDIDTDIAVIGMSCRFPGADDVSEFWENLRKGKETISRFSVDDLVAAGFDREQVSHPDYVKASPVLRDPAGFDAEFFGYSAREAELLDPQQRLLLHCAWEALEDAAYNPLALKDRVGAFVGASMNTYFVNNVLPNRDRLDSRDPIDVFTLDSMGGFQAMVANDKDYVSTRVSYKLDLRGPSLNVQTACSTGLVVVHLGVKSLINGECEMALAATSSVQAPQAAGHLWQEGMIVSPDGHCRAFDSEAGGTIFGSGVGAVLLKPLRKAQEDGDNIYAVIRGSALNNDGGQKVGYMAPSGAGETDVARKALQEAAIDPQTVGFLEAHGTGTRVGDPIEARSLAKAYRGNGKAKQWCALGSVKTNVGHLQISSGIAGFMKAVLALHHREIPPTLHFNTPNPDCEFENSPFHVNTQTIAWPESPDHPRRAGVNSLGIGGTNAHVVLEEAPLREKQQDNAPTERPWHILALTARSEAALDRLQGKYLEFVKSHPQTNPADLAYSANTGRKAFECRRFFVYDSLTTLREKLETSSRDANDKAVQLSLSRAPASKRIGTDMLESAPVFAELLEEYDEVATMAGHQSILTCLRDEKVDAEKDGFDLIAGTAIQLALGGFLRSLGIPMRVFVGDPDLVSVIAGKMPFAELLEQFASSPSGKPELGAASNDDAHQLSLLAETSDDDLWPHVLNLIGELVVSGHAIDWAKLDAPHSRRRLSLPTYPFDTKRYWLDAPQRQNKTGAATAAAGNSGTQHPLIDQTFSTPASPAKFFVAQYDPERHSLLRDHLINDAIVVSGACHMSMVLGTASQIPGTEINNVTFAHPLVLSDQGTEAHLVIEPSEKEDASRFKLAYTDLDGNAKTCVQGKIRHSVIVPANAPTPPDCPITISTDEYDSVLAEKNITLGPSYRWASNICRGDGRATCQLVLPKDISPSDAEAYGFHPGLLDGCFGLMIAATAKDISTSGTFVPAGFDRMVIYQLPKTNDTLTAIGTFETAGDGQSATGTIHLVSSDGNLVLSIEGLVGRSTDLSTIKAPKTASSSAGLYVINWHERQAPAESVETSSILILASDDQQNVAKNVGHRLAQHGHNVEPVLVEPDKNQFETALDRALSNRGEDGKTIIEILDLRADPIAVLENLQLLITRESDAVGTVRLSLLCDAAIPESAGMTGLVKVMGLEHPGISCRTIRLDLSDAATSSLEQLVGALREPIDAAGEIDVSTGARRCPQLDPITVSQQDLRCQSDGTYIVSGASGALGGILMDWLIAAGAGTIVALSRSGKIDPEITRKSADKGINIVSIAADVTDPITLPDDLPPVRGVIHAAGVLDDATLLKATKTQLTNVIAPKFDGARHLYDLVKDTDIDFFVMFSSAASVIGNRGQGAYAAANAMIDAYAAELRHQGVPATTISWGPWAGDGMASRTALTSATFERLGISSLSKDRALSLLQAAIASERAHVTAIDCDWSTFVTTTKELGGKIDDDFFADVLPRDRREKEPQRAPAKSSTAPLVDQLKQADSADWKTIIHDFVQGRVVDALSFAGVATIEPDQALMDQGLDSLGSVGLRNDLNEALGKTFPVGLFFEYPTLNQLVGHLHEVMQDELDADNAPSVATSTKTTRDAEDDFSALDDLDLDALNELVKKELDG